MQTGDTVGSQKYSSIAVGETERTQRQQNILHLALPRISLSNVQLNFILPSVSWKYDRNFRLDVGKESHRKMREPELRNLGNLLTNELPSIDIKYLNEKFSVSFT